MARLGRILGTAMVAALAACNNDITGGGGGGGPVPATGAYEVILTSNGPSFSYQGTIAGRLNGQTNTLVLEMNVTDHSVVVSLPNPAPGTLPVQNVSASGVARVTVSSAFLPVATTRLTSGTMVLNGDCTANCNGQLTGTTADGSTVTVTFVNVTVPRV